MPNRRASILLPTIMVISILIMVGWRGFEILTRKPVQATEDESHEFAFLSQGQPGNPLLPVLDVEFHTGIAGNQIGAVRPSLTDEEAIEAWDKLTSSIRVRPTHHP